MTSLSSLYLKDITTSQNGLPVSESISPRILEFVMVAVVVDHRIVQNTCNEPITRHNNPGKSNNNEYTKRLTSTLSICHLNGI